MSIFETIELTTIQDEQTRKGIVQLLNLVEALKQETVALRAENQRLKDEINRLKGEQGQPEIPANRPRASVNYSSEKERRQIKARASRHQGDAIPVSREVILAVERATLPADAVFKGYDEVVVQDLVLRTDNVLFRKEVFWSASARRSYRASLPAGYQGS